MIRIGAHQSISGGYSQALDKIHKIGGNCLQIFSSSPRGWNFPQINNNDIQSFKKNAIKLNINPIVFHASYLINLADDSKIGHLSKKSLINELNIASKLEIIGTIVHLGSFKGSKTEEKYQILINNIRKVLDETPDNTYLLIENAGNNKIGQSLDELSQIVRNVGNRRIGVCLDTCHLYSAGYDLSTPQKLQAFLAEFEKQIGIDKLKVFHLNDSKDLFNSGRDRHENIGQGAIPLEEFEVILKHSQLNKLPFIIETPGFDNKGPDKKNLDILKKLISV